MLILSTSANPLHCGHLSMAQASEKMVGQECVFLLTKRNADKSELTDDEVNERVKQFEDIGRDYLVTDKATFVSIAQWLRKTRHLPYTEDIYFVVGMDTITRVNDPKYCFNSVEERDLLLRRLSSLRVFFVICERNGLSFSDLPGKIEKGLLNLCRECKDYKDSGESSTKIREAETRP
jgi:nicotinic acid mononucleotide adenylyltransferase